MNLILGRGFGGGNCRIMRCMVGVAVYHVAPWFVKWVQNEGLRRGGRMIVPPDRSGARKEARRPWMWNRGMMRMVRSFGVSWYVRQIFSGFKINRALFYSNVLDVPTN